MQLGKPNSKQRGVEPRARTVRVIDLIWDAVTDYARADKRSVNAEVAWILEEYVRRREREEGR